MDMLTTVQGQGQDMCSAFLLCFLGEGWLGTGTRNGTLLSS